VVFCFWVHKGFSHARFRSFDHEMPEGGGTSLTIRGCRACEVLPRFVRSLGCAPSKAIMRRFHSVGMMGEFSPRKIRKHLSREQVSTLGFGFGWTGIGVGRIGDVFGRAAASQGEPLVRVPHRARVFPQFRGFLASECAHFVHVWAPSGAFFTGGRCRGWLPPSILVATGGCSLPVHGRSWFSRHDL
jgi:hypothetical protein